MGCLFGYCGAPAPELPARMAKILSHRCPNGWAHETLEAPVGTVAIGHGMTRRHSTGAQLVRHGQQLMGHAGIFFKPPLFQSFTSATLTALEGAFTLAFTDGEAFYLVRDPTGVKTLYWTLHGDRLLFASEIKALFADSTVPRRLRPAALTEYLSFSFVPGSNTMFDNIYELQPGCVLKFERGQVNIQRHFRCEALEELPPMSEDEHVEAIRQALEQSVRECCDVAQQTPGVFLSGGIDSSTVLAMTCRALPEQRIHSFSVDFGEEYPNENEFIEMMVSRYKTDHHRLEVRPAGFLEQLDEIIWRLDDPIGDPVAMPNYLLAGLAAEHTDTILNGEGGDPCLGGPKNIPMLLSRLYGTPDTESADGRLERHYLHSFQRGYQDLKAMLTPDALREAGGDEALVELLRPFFQQSPQQHFLNTLMSMNIRLKGANLILVKVDKMTSAHGLLALPPMFSKRIVEASMRCPPGLKLAGNNEKNVLKMAVQDLLPQAIIDRPKSGMRVPVSFWFRGEMRAYARKRLSRKQIIRTGLFNPDYVKHLLDYDREGRVPGMRHGLKLWMLTTFMLWRERMLGE